MQDILLFDKWDMNIEVNDPGLINYINLNPIMIPRYKNKLEKRNNDNCNIIEKFARKLMTPGHKGKKHFKSSGSCTGKYENSIKIMKSVFEKIEEKCAEYSKVMTV